MSRKILMVQLSHRHIIEDDSFKMLPSFEYSRSPSSYPLGLGYLSNALSDSGYEKAFIDLWVHPEQIHYLFSVVNNFDAIGISFYVTQYNQLRYITSKIKERNSQIPIIVGGPGAGPAHKIILRHIPFDFVVFEEAEISFINLLNEIFNNKNYKNVKGIAFKDGGGSIVVTEPQPYIKNLDALDFPDRDCLDFKVYSRDSTRSGVKDLVVGDIISGRGCPYQCIFCSKTFQGFRQRSVANIIREVMVLKEKYAVQEIAFDDELVVTSRERIYELCDGLKGLNLKWGCQGRVNLVDRQILKRMKDSGCVYIGYGFENATQRILDNMKKDIDAKDMINIYRMTKEAGLVPIVQYMYGFLGENGESLRNSIEFFKDIDHPATGFFTHPIVGTELYNYCLEKGYIKDEKEYLENFFYGYNKLECTINFSEFSDLEILNKKIWETRRIINFNYYRRHPIKAFRKVKEYYHAFGWNGFFKKYFRNA